MDERVISTQGGPQQWANKWMSQVLHIINTQTQGDLDAWLRKVAMSQGFRIWGCNEFVRDGARQPDAATLDRLVAENEKLRVIISEQAAKIAELIGKIGQCEVCDNWQGANRALVVENERLIDENMRLAEESFDVAFENQQLREKIVRLKLLLRSKKQPYADNERLRDELASFQPAERAPAFPLGRAIQRIGMFRNEPP